MKKLRSLIEISESIGGSIVREMIAGGNSLPQNVSDFIGRFVKIKPINQSTSVQDIDVLINSITEIEEQK